MISFFQLDNPVVRIFSRLFELILLHVLFILFSLPIVTIGASITALYTVTLKMARREDQYVWKTFITSFRKNMKQSIFAWLFIVITGMVLFADIYYVSLISGVWKVIFMSFTTIFAFVYFTLFLLIFPYIARFEDGLRKAVLNVLLIGKEQILFILGLMIMNGSLLVFILSSFTGFITGIYLFTFGGFAWLAYLNGMMINKMFARYEKIA